MRNPYSILQGRYYHIDPVVKKPISSGTFKLNGKSDIFDLNQNQFPDVERSFFRGRVTCATRLYLAELEEAENISSVSSL